MKQEVPSGFYLRTAGEVAGLYQPGEAPLLFESEAIDINSTRAHEVGHKQLCDTSPLGLYLKGLVLSVRGKGEAEAAAVSRLVALCIQQCWYCQEGYATYKQLNYLLSRGKVADARSLRASLLSPYSVALANFDFEGFGISELLASSEGDVSNVRVLVALEFAAYVVARGAMSLPLSQILNRAAFDDREVLLAVRKDPPDLRLKTLKAHCCQEYIESISREVFLAFEEMKSVKTSRPLDDRMDRCASALCRKAGVRYQASYEVDVSRMFSTMGVLGVEFEDQRDMHLRKSLAFEADSRVVRGKGFVTDRDWKDSLTVSDTARYSLALPVEKLSGGKSTAPDVVCELIPFSSADDCYYPSFHFFATFGLSEGGQEVAGLLKLGAEIPQAIFSEEKPSSLPGLVPHQSWVWIVHWTVFVPGASFRLLDFDELSSFGPVLSPVLPHEHVHGRHSDTYNVSGFHALAGSGQDGSSFVLERAKGSDGVALLYQSEDDLIKPLFVSFVPGIDHSPHVTKASPVLQRVCAAIASGAYAMISAQSGGE
ncbi:MAG: hypothetical protein SX243_13585 [Acidobacteriota bacterium]|nr:hypothetical protein [Acidobacteriota bacterium]